MNAGAITDYIDVAQLALYGFWIFFAGLIYYLRSEDKREGYPLESDRSGRVTVQGFPPIPRPKTFLLQHGETRVVPNFKRDTRPIAAEPSGAWLGAPLEPTGNPMRDGVGPAAYAQRAAEPDLTIYGSPKIVPLRLASEYTLEARDPDPRGMTVVGADRVAGGVVRDVWVDRSETVIRYLEVEILSPSGIGRVLLPINFSRIDGRRRVVRVKAIRGEQFSDVPRLQNPDQITFLEEDMITAYYASGHLYALPLRAEPIL
jgi:photosynthetic reaction center H subunit